MSAVFNEKSSNMVRREDDLMQRHRDLTEALARQVKHFYDRKLSFRVYHGSTNSTRQSSHTRGSIIETSSLNTVICIDSQAMSALVEPNVAMDQLVRATLAYDLIPPVVMEFPGITVGGGFAGTAGESSSFKYGTFDCTIKSIEVILGNGFIVRASADENADLFYGASGTCGTLGVVTLLEVSLIPAKPYVELSYQPVQSSHEAIQAIQEASHDPSIGYLDGIIFSDTSAVIMKGKLAPSPPSSRTTHRFSRSYDQWFYRATEKKLARSRNKPWTEHIPTQKYLFRYDRGAFWGGKIAFEHFHVPFDRFTRWLLNPWMHTRTMYHALHESGLADQIIVQDLEFPFETVEEFLDVQKEMLGIYPLWLCPIVMSKLSSPETDVEPIRPFAGGRAFRSGEPLLNVGVWGKGPRNPIDFININRDLEHRVRSFSGVKCLYARTYYTEDEFWTVYDKERYDELRTLYGADFLPTVYDKVKADLNVKPRKQRLRGLYGVWRATVGGDYLLRKKS